MRTQASMKEGNTHNPPKFPSKFCIKVENEILGKQNSSGNEDLVELSTNMAKT